MTNSAVRIVSRSLNAVVQVPRSHNRLLLHHCHLKISLLSGDLYTSSFHLCDTGNLSFTMCRAGIRLIYVLNVIHKVTVNTKHSSRSQFLRARLSLLSVAIMVNTQTDLIAVLRCFSLISCMYMSRLIKYRI